MQELWYVVILILGMFGVYYLVQMYHNSANKNFHQEGISGIYMSEAKSAAHHIRTDRRHDNQYIHHQQGTAVFQDETWVRRPGTSMYMINATSYAIAEDMNTVHIYEDQKRIDTLYRNKQSCPMLKGEFPTYSNFEKYYDLVNVEPLQVDQLAEVLHKKKACAVIEDFNIHVGGPHANEYMARGYFAMDKKRTCYFYVPGEVISIIMFQSKINQQTVDIQYFRDALFAGAMA